MFIVAKCLTVLTCYNEQKKIQHNLCHCHGDAKPSDSV